MLSKEEVAALIRELQEALDSMDDDRVMCEHCHAVYPKFDDRWKDPYYRHRSICYCTCDD